jgi:CRP-like cAMP-binding protein
MAQSPFLREQNSSAEEQEIAVFGNAAAPIVSERAPPSEEIRGVLEQLGLRGRRLTLSKGSVISLHDGPQAGLHLLSRGRMKTLWFSKHGRVMILDVLGTGDVFGEMSLLDDAGSEPTVAEALGDVEIDSLSRFVLEKALKAGPALAIALTRLVGARRQRLERRLGTQVFLRVPTRLALLLLDLAERFGEALPSYPAASAGERRFLLDIPLSQQELGNLIGASRESVSLTLSRFRRRGAVSMHGRNIVIDSSKLRFEANTRDG